MPTNQSPSDRCDACDSTIDSQLMHGLCPRCLLATAISTEPQIDETLDTAASDKQDPNFNPDDIERDQPTLGDYVLIDEIARGGMGVVYRARHQTLGREVALKLILSGEFASERDLRRFHLEAESAAALEHPGIVPIYDIGQQDGRHFFTMKLIEGGALSQKMPFYREQPREFAALIAKTADAIDYAHRRGILHRDLKPANILLEQTDSKSYVPVITDLGLAKHIQSKSDLTGTGAIVGTPAYMTPEQASASKEITTSADIFSLGAILYDALAGRPPHQGESAIATLMEAAKGEIVLPSEHNPNVDRTLELICLKCLARDPEQRYSSARLLAKDLRHWLAGESVSVKPKSFALICGDMIRDQLRSAIGAMLLGICGGLALGVPIYCGLANQLFGRSDSRFSLQRLREELPSADLAYPNWVTPPDFNSVPILFSGVLFCLFLGVFIQKLIKPQDIRQAIAVGLVAGLLMAIVEFAMYGIAANWQTFAIVNADLVDQLATASYAEPIQREQATKELVDAFPEFATMGPTQRAELYSQFVSTRIMLSSPVVLLSCLAGCLLLAGVFCVLGTVHAYRLAESSYSLANRTWRYLEVISLLAVSGFLACVCVFRLSGMIASQSDADRLSVTIITPLVLLMLAVIPGWRLSAWHTRLLVYVAVGGGIIAVFSKS